MYRHHGVSNLCSLIGRLCIYNKDETSQVEFIDFGWFQCGTGSGVGFSFAVKRIKKVNRREYNLSSGQSTVF